MADSEAETNEPTYLVMPENKEALSKRWKMSKTQRNDLRGSHWPNKGQCEHENNS